ncbi:hypothetical protein GGR57DRAFT_477945 [Xylariaceae sp. FL1272]|nr:hypothetical protein GGR57DRAFT_477945 [Xylariaceae sp. FL1272]
MGSHLRQTSARVTYVRLLRLRKIFHDLLLPGALDLAGGLSDKMAETTIYHGSLVAFEGPRDIVSTQLRLLPSSSKILILPPLQDFVHEDEPATTFDPRSHILKIHEACNARSDMAHTFLRKSTPENKRLVFMNGGTVTAQMSCVNTISKRVTDGDVARAETMFDELIRNGVAGLERRPDCSKATGSMTQENEVMKEDCDEVRLEDPIIAAMRAAEALDRRTASLQAGDELDLPGCPRPRSTSVPIRSAVDDLQDVAPFYVFGSPVKNQSQSQAVPKTPEYSSVEKWRIMTASVDQLTDPNAAPRSPICVGETYHEAPSTPTKILSPQTLTFDCTPHSPAELGEARVIDLRSTLPTSTHKRLKSLDRIYAPGIRNQDISLCQSPPPLLPGRPNSSQDTERSLEEKETAVILQRRSVLRSKFNSDNTRPALVNPKPTVIKRRLCSQVEPLALKTAGPRPAPYVDRGTNPVRNYVDRYTLTDPIGRLEEEGKENASSFLNLDDDFELDIDEPFRTVLPMAEDLVIHFKSDERNLQLETLIQRFKDGTYPVSMPPLLPESENMDGPITPSSGTSTPKADRNNTLDSQRIADMPMKVYQVDTDEYDPFASHGNYLQSPRACPPPKSPNTQRPQIIVPTPPTPVHTPPPPETTPASDTSFHGFDTTECQTAVGTQNSLRSILSVYFPPDEGGYQQFDFPLLPELSSMWRPVFRRASSDSLKKADRKIDLILAIGAQRGVDREFLGAISGSLEKLGTKPSGITRSGRLDLRYLIANAMQAFTAQPLANQAQENPFNNPLLLATLITPHLETYMAAHSGTRFLLLEYPSEHLSTVLALQHLVGVDLLKVAGILDGESKESKPRHGLKKSRSKISSESISSMSGLSSLGKRSGATLISKIGSKSPASVSKSNSSFSKANFIITSAATESEIATLISTIWKILVDISSFYIPDGTVSSRHSLQHPAKRRSLASLAETETDSINRSSKRNSRERPLADTPLLDTEQKNAPLASAAAMIGFSSSTYSSSPTDTPRGPPSPYVSTGTHADLPLPLPFSLPSATPTSTVPLSNPLKSSRGSIAETILSSRTYKTSPSQRSKLRHLLGRDLPATPLDLGRPSDACSYIDVSDDESIFRDEERKYIPMFDQSMGPRKGNSRKALKWLGLAI